MFFSMAASAFPIPGAPEPLPDTMDYDLAQRRLHIGKGYIDNVPPEVRAYEVSGMNVLRQWFSYRKRDRTRPIIGDRRPPSPLSDIQPDHWAHEYTSDLIDLLNVLGRLVLLEPKQAEFLQAILAGKLSAGPLLRRKARLRLRQPPMQTACENTQIGVCVRPQRFRISIDSGLRGELPWSG